MRDDVLWTLLAIFVPLSFTTIGGGQGIVAEIHRQVMLQGWMPEQQFVYDFALSRLAPGPGSLLVTLIGWQVAGWAGALVASVAIFLPSSLLLYGLARLWARYRGRPWQRAVERGLAPVAAGLILAASLTVLEAAQGGWIAWSVALCSTLALPFTRLSPFVVLGLGGLVFLATT
ncbi:MAG TPA: chromate transporter [Acetobacteraceae bacterium]|nr:chromate transporter [Acetobacteraceae bacterium]